METIIGTVTTVAGVELTVKKDQHHFRAYDKDGKQHGSAWIECENLANELRFTMPETGPAPKISKPEATAVPVEIQHTEANITPCNPGDQSPIERARCGHFKDEICAMDKLPCDGKCGEHASRAMEEAEQAIPSDAQVPSADK